jgi:Ca2+-binding EF-hand superfamily protein
MQRPTPTLLALLTTALCGISIAAFAANTVLPPSTNHDAHITEQFAHADSDKNGQLSLAEFKTMPREHGAKHGKAHAMLAKIAQADANHDGQISKAEAERDLPRLAQRFAQIDVNKNGQISPAEMTTHREQKQHHRFDGHKS